MPAASGLVIGSVDRSLVEALRTCGADPVVVSDGAMLGRDTPAAPEIVCLSFSVAAGVAAPIDELRARFPGTAFLVVVPASEIPAGKVVARELDADVIASPVDTRRAMNAIDAILARRARARELDALLVRVRELDPGIAAFVEALGRDREAKARALEEALLFRSTILANLAHEIRTPLAVVEGFVDLLDESFAGTLDSDQQELLRGIRSGSGQLVKVFQSLVDLARADTGRIDRRPASVYLPELLSELAREIEPELEGRPVRFVLDVERRLGWIRTEPDWLRQIVACLLSNAAKFTSLGEIRLSARSIDEAPAPDPVSALLRSPLPLRSAIEIEVADTGRGIAAAEQARIFEAFHQEDSSMTRRHEGLGIGLTVVRELAREVGATLDLESRIDEGTRVRLRIPFDRVRDRRSDREALTPPPRPPRAEQPSATPLVEIARLHRLVPGSLGDAIPLALHALEGVLEARVSLFADRADRAWRIADAVGEAAAAVSEPPADLLDRAVRDGRASLAGGNDDRWFAIAVRDLADEPLGILVCRTALDREAEAWPALQAAGGWLALVHAARALAAERIELTAALSRSVKDPLGALLAYTQVLSRGLRGSLTDEQRAIVLRLEKGIHRATLAALDLLDFARARGAPVAVTSARFPLARVVDHVLARHAAALELGGIRVDRAPGLESADALGDEIRTDRAFSALIRAFVDGAPASGGSMSVTARAAESWIALELAGSVTDAASFEQAFGTAPPPLALDDPVGLTLARLAIEAQGGSIALDEGEGRLVVTLRLPRAGVDG